MKHTLIPQEESLGCSVACVASLLGINYQKALKLFGKSYNNKKGSYCDEITKVLKKNLPYEYSKVNNKTKKYINKIGSIIFIKNSKKYPKGHYLLKTEKGFMNSWINSPKINPAEAGFIKKLPGKAEWIIYKNK